MEDILEESKQSLTPPGNHDAQVRLVVLLGLLVIAVVIAVFFFDNYSLSKISTLETSLVPTDVEDDAIEAPLSDVMPESILMGWNRDESGFVSVVGEVTDIWSVPERKDVNGAIITLLVSPVVDATIFPASEKFYQFSFSEPDTVGFPSNIAIGDRVTMYGVAEPSEEWSVLAKKIEKR